MGLSQTQTASQTDGVTLQALIAGTVEWVKYLSTKWLILLVAGIIGAVGGGIFAWLKKPQYTGKLSFVLEDANASPLGAYSGLASQFGFDIGGSFSSGVFSSDNITGFLTSRLMVEKTLLSTVNMNGKKETLANIYIDTYELQKKWEGDSLLENLGFPVDVSRDKFSLQQDSILNVLQERIIKKNLSIVKPEKTSTFITVKCTSRNEVFSKEFTERLVYEATNFYIETKTKRSKSNVEKLQQKADSIESLLNKKTYSVAASQDMNLNPARSLAAVNTELIARDKIVLQTMFGEVVKNLEISKMTMSQETPIIQIVDVPIFPLEKEKIGLILAVIIGGFLAGLLTVAYLILKRVFKDIVA